MEERVEEFEYINEDIELKGEDLINAVAYYKAKEAGLIEDTGIPDSSYGVLGAMATDVMTATRDYFEGKINEEELESSIDRSLFTAVSTIATTAITAVTKPIGEFIKSKIPPVLHHVVDGAITFVREKLVKEAVRLVEKGWNLAKSFVKKIFA